MTEEKKAKIKKYVIKDFLLFGGLFLIFALAYIIWGINCPMRLLLKIQCPFCGMTRAHLAAFRLDFLTAFHHHPLFFLGIPYILLLTHEEHFSKKHKKFYHFLAYLMTGLFIGCYIIRYIIPSFF